MHVIDELGGVQSLEGCVRGVVENGGCGKNSPSSPELFTSLQRGKAPNKGTSNASGASVDTVRARSTISASSRSRHLLANRHRCIES